VIVVVDSEGRLAIPQSLGQVLPGEPFEVSAGDADGTMVLRRAGVKADWLEVLKECPIPMDDIEHDDLA
jgi:bifunctional DNA-binding transcriptional regulator/antitoxin component of YhaV-PrlF toxin-antitoxin module